MNGATGQRLRTQGVIGRGQGLASGWIMEDSTVWEALASDLYLNGTLNLYVSGGFPTFEQDFRGRSVRLAGFIHAVPCSLKHCSAFILRIEDRGFRKLLPPPSRMLEIIAPNMPVREGDIVTIEFNPWAIQQYWIR
jgi:hypothetical protein